MATEARGCKLSKEITSRADPVAKVDRCQPVPLTDPVGVQETSERPRDHTHQGPRANQRRPEWPEENEVPILKNQSSAGRQGGGGVGEAAQTNPRKKKKEKKID